MPKLKILVSLITNNNDYQLAQAQDAEEAARKLGVDAQIIFADNDAVNQSTQLLRAIQSAPEDRPNAIVMEPAGGTGLPQVGRAAVNAGIAWAVLNRDAAYLTDLRQSSKVPVFGVSADQFEVGRIQSRQCMALLPRGGSILHIHGPSETSAAKERNLGFLEVKPANIHVTVLKGQWTEESAQRSVRSWLKLSTSQKSAMDLIVSQNDSMAIGARKAFQELPVEYERERWLSLPYLGVDGVPKTGQAWVRSGLLKATIVTPPCTGLAIEMIVDGLLHKKAVPERGFTTATSMPPVEALRGS
jgi:ABC-type sugar transport system substrate-binding protein